MADIRRLTIGEEGLAEQKDGRYGKNVERDGAAQQDDAGDGKGTKAVIA